MFFLSPETTRNRLIAGGIPKHIAIIMDGNGTWAKRRGLPRTAGHAKGADALRRTLKEAAILGVHNLSVYAFSTENWKRPKKEVNYLMELFWKSLQKEIPELIKNKIQVRFLGDLSKFSKNLQIMMKKAEKETTFKNPRCTLNVLLNYGGRAEILRGINLAIKNKKILKKETDFDQLLYTAGISDPELLIRTSGQIRISNFLLWQCAYTEFWFTPICWPDFGAKLLQQAITDYQKRTRRVGGLNAV